MKDPLFFVEIYGASHKFRLKRLSTKAENSEGQFLIFRVKLISWVLTGLLGPNNTKN